MTSSEACAVRNCPSQVEGGASFLGSRMELVKNKIIVVSGRDCVGKSTTAVNLAFALAKRGTRVGLFDVDAQGAVIQELLDFEGGVPHIDGESICPCEIAGIKVVTLQSLALHASEKLLFSKVERANASQRSHLEIAWGRLDYLIFNGPPGFDGAASDAAELFGQGGAAVVVSSTQEIGSTDLEIPLSSCKAMKLPVIGVVESMSTDICPHCGEHPDNLKNGGAYSLTQKAGHELLARIPFDSRLAMNGEKGEPFLLSEPHSEVSKAYITLAESVATYWV